MTTARLLLNPVYKDRHGLTVRFARLAISQTCLAGAKSNQPLLPLSGVSRSHVEVRLSGDYQVNT